MGKTEIHKKLDELFENPNHTFVGYFIGSPGMNLIDVTATKSGIEFDGISIPFSENRLDQLNATSSSNIKIGIRPEFVHVWNKPTEDAYKCEVMHVEDLGTYKILTLQLASHTIKARLDEDHKIPEKNAYISFPEQWLKLYIDEFLVEENHA